MRACAGTGIDCAAPIRSAGSYGLAITASIRCAINCCAVRDIGCTVTPDESGDQWLYRGLSTLRSRTVTRPATRWQSNHRLLLHPSSAAKLGLKALEIACHPSEGMRVDSSRSGGTSRTAREACLVNANFSNPTGPP